MEKDYSILNLDCAHCGAKIEEALNRLEEIELAVLNFPMRKIKVIGSCTEELLDKMNKVAYDIEPGSQIVPFVENTTKQFEIRNVDIDKYGSAIENVVKNLSGVKSAVLDPSTKRLKVKGTISEEFITQMNNAASAVAGGVELVPYSVRGSQRKSRLKEIVDEIEENASHHHHDEHCGCGHDHEHEHEHHHHDEHCDCSHDHEYEHDHHDEHCDCGHDHEHEHEHHHHDEHCDCGHDHEHEHEHHHHDEHCDCGHDHEHEREHKDYEEYEVTLGVHSAGDHEYHGEHELTEQHCEESEYVNEYKEILGDMYNDEPVTIRKRALPDSEKKVGRYERVHDEHKHTHEEEEQLVHKPASHEKEPDLVSELVSEKEMRSSAFDEDISQEKPFSMPEKAKEKNGEVPIEAAELLVGLEVFIAALISHKMGWFTPVTIGLFVAAYLILGINVLKATVKNIKAKNFFNENLLMTVATIGAFALGEYPEAVGVMLFFRIGELFENYAVARSRKAITAVAELQVDEADVLIDGEFVRVPAEEIEKGDILRIKVGERIAADGVVESGKTKIDTSAVNGEPVPLVVRAGDPVYSGCINLSEAITLRTTAPASESMISKIAEAVEDASASKPHIDRFITRFSKIYTPIVIGVALLTAIIPSLITGDWQKWVYAALTFLVISCPCALVLSVPLAYFSGIGAASKMGILFKGGDSIEALAKVKAVAFDKTGTLTNGTFTVTQVQSFGVLSNRHLLRICGSCEIASTHPVAESIVAYCHKNNLKLGTPENISEIAGRGVEAEVSGRTVLCGNEKMMSEYDVPIPKGQPADGGSVVYIAIDGKVEGRIVVADTIKKTSHEAISTLNAMGIHTAMFTGDKNENARITGKKLGVEVVKGELLPDEKLKEIEELRNVYGPVMFVGDGINDGPVLAGADVGGAMHTGSHLALEAADTVFMNPEPNTVVNSKKLADKTQRIAYENIIFALVIKAAVLALGLLGMPNMWLAVFADSGTAMLLILNSIRNLSIKGYKTE
ncbi:MAG: cadmium-translocating P-type ATPase [Ruminococcus sp.]|nr:cadmium-translocating P-type ATPase [Ruminococcus sp.]